MFTVTVAPKSRIGKKLIEEHGRVFEVNDFSPVKNSVLLWCKRNCKCGGGHVQRVTLGHDVETVCVR